MLQFYHVWIGSEARVTNPRLHRVLGPCSTRPDQSILSRGRAGGVVHCSEQLGDANWNLRLQGDKAELKLQRDGNRLLLTFGAVESSEAFDLLNPIDKCALLI